MDDTVAEISVQVGEILKIIRMNRAMYVLNDFFCYLCYLSSSRVWNMDARRVNEGLSRPGDTLKPLRSIDPAQVPVNELISDFPVTLEAISELDSEFKKKLYHV